MKTLLVVLLILSAALSASQAQAISPRVMSTAGDYTTSGNLSISCTLGELAVQTLTAGDLILSPGFLPEDYSTLTVTLLQAIKEQQEIIKSRNQSIRDLEGRIADLEQTEPEVAELKALVGDMRKHLGLLTVN